MEDNFDRLTVVEMVYHRPYGEETLAVDTRFTRKVDSGEQPYQRLCHKPTNMATEEWKELDFGWLKESIGMIVIVNNEGFYPLNPTEEEEKEVESRVIEIGYSEKDTWEIPPRESFRGTPSNPSGLRIRCRSGMAKYTLTVLPK